ncbi:MAG: efflux RND transporter periplasmic adaptor subunit [Brotaphodocola sp.]
MQVNKKVVAVGAVVVVAAVVLAKILTPKTEEKVTAPPSVAVAQMETGTIELYRNLVGSVEPSDVVYIYPKANGEITDIFVKTGDEVEQGQLLCIIDTKAVDAARLNLEAAQTALEDEQTNYGRQQALFEAGDISTYAWEQAQKDLKNARIQYDSAKVNYDTQMEFSYVTATIGGKVESFNPKLHDMASPQELLCVISGEGSKTVTFSLPEKIQKRLAVGERVSIDKSGEKYEGVITEISTVLDNSTGLFKIKASVDGGDGLQTGASVKLSVVSDKAENVDTLPVDCIYYEGGKPFVYLYDNGTVHQIPVEVGIYDSERIEILGGVSEEDQVICSWSSELFEGSSVRLATETDTEDVQ